MPQSGGGGGPSDVSKRQAKSTRHLTQPSERRIMTVILPKSDGCPERAKVFPQSHSKLPLQEPLPLERRNAPTSGLTPWVLPGIHCPPRPSLGDHL